MVNSLAVWSTTKKTTDLKMRHRFLEPRVVEKNHRTANQTTWVTHLDPHSKDWFFHDIN